MKDYHIRFSFFNIIHITICVSSLLLWCYSSSQVLTIQERWRFESIPNQLVIYSSHKPRFPRQGRLDHQWHFPSSRGTLPRDRPTAKTHLELTLRVPVIPPSAPVCQSEFIPDRIVSLASRSKGTLFDQLNMRHAFNMTRGMSMAKQYFRF
jgi:hypothetical protein